MSKTLLSGLLLLAMGSLAVVFGVKEKKTPPTVSLSSSVSCDAAITACLLSDGQRLIGLHFPDGARYLKPFDVVVRIGGFDGEKIKKVTIEPGMRGMDMGANRFNLHLLDNPQNSGMRFGGKIILPLCISGRNDWQASLRIETEKTIYESRFSFHVAKQGVATELSR